jgi:hypothetical protein
VYRDALLEVGFLPWQRVSTPVRVLSSHHLAPSFRGETTIAGPRGRFGAAAYTVAGAAGDRCSAGRRRRDRNCTADRVTLNLAQVINQLPDMMWRSITHDQGIEMIGHARFTVSTGIDAYFYDPYSRRQRDTNENTNGLLRQQFPKRTDPSIRTQAELDAAGAGAL